MKTRRANAHSPASSGKQYSAEKRHFVTNYGNLRRRFLPSVRHGTCLPDCTEKGREKVLESARHSIRCDRMFVVKNPQSERRKNVVLAASASRSRESPNFVARRDARRGREALKQAPRKRSSVAESIHRPRLSAPTTAFKPCAHQENAYGDHARLSRVKRMTLATMTSVAMASCVVSDSPPNATPSRTAIKGLT